MEMNAIVVERRVETTISKTIFQYADHMFRIGVRALIYSRNHGRWIGPYVVSVINGRMVTVKSLEETRTILFNSFQLKPYCDGTKRRISSRQNNNQNVTYFDTCISKIIN